MPDARDAYLYRLRRRAEQLLREAGLLERPKPQAEGQGRAITPDDVVNMVVHLAPDGAAVRVSVIADALRAPADEVTKQGLVAVHDKRLLIAAQVARDDEDLDTPTAFWLAHPIVER